MSIHSESIEIEVPIGAAYNQWTQFEHLPHFMRSVLSVVQLDDGTLRWDVAIAGVRRQWDASILDQQPDARISWMSTTGAQNTGVVTFERIAPYSTRVNLVLEFQPKGLVEWVGNAFGFVSHRSKRELESFRDFIEARSASTGSWRGRIEGGVVAATSEMTGEVDHRR